jgi:hypothetical protein
VLYELLPYSRVWHELLTLGFVKVTRGYVKYFVSISGKIQLSYDKALALNPIK